MTLLDTAKQYNGKPGRKVTYTDEQLDLFWAYINDEISGVSVIKAMGYSVRNQSHSHSVMRSKCLTVLLEAWKDGKIEIKRK